MKVYFDKTMKRFARNGISSFCIALKNGFTLIIAKILIKCTWRILVLLVLEMIIGRKRSYEIN